MGLFDFIKKKLFGKSKKVEESKKVEKKIESKEIEKPLIPSKPKPKKVTKEKKIVTKKIKEEKPKKGILSKIKDTFISPPDEKEIKDKTSKPKTNKKDDKINKKSKVDKEEQKVVEAPKEEEFVEELKEKEVIEEPKEEEVIEEPKEEEVVEEPKEKEVIEEPKEEEVIEEPKKEEVVEEPKEEEVVEEPKEEEIVEEPKVEEIVEEPEDEESQTIPDEDSESLKKGLEKTKKSFFSKLKSAVLGKSKIDDDVLDELEEVLITSDVGVETTVKIIERIEERVSKDKYTSINELNNILKEEIVKILAENSSDLDAFDVSEDTVPYVILVVGVNGVGKTTTIGKLAAQFKEGGLKVLIGAADTFRAAAVDQIQMWGKKVGVDVVSHGMNTDPASVAYDTVKKAVEENYHVVIIDTAGRLHTKLNLMNELSKIKRVVQKFKEDAPHEVMLILDGSTGQNAFIQAEEFTKATDVNSITITKLDGTAKGGVVIGITDRFKIPIKYVGVGEKVGDLKLFHKGEFVSSFFD